MINNWKTSRQAPGDLFLETVLREWSSVTGVLEWLVTRGWQNAC